MSPSPFDSVARRIRTELREAVQHQINAYQSIESGKGRTLSLHQAWVEWNEAHRQDLGQLLMIRKASSVTSSRWND